MDEPIKVLFITAYPLWAEACTKALATYRRSIEAVVQVADDGLKAALDQPHITSNAVVLLSLDIPFVGLDIIRTVSSSNHPAVILIVNSHHSLPSLQELTEAGVQAIITSFASFDELAASIYRLIDQRPEPLPRQYRRAVRALTRLLRQPITLTKREKQILQLLAYDMTDQEIAERLNINTHTVSNHLHYIYAKLGVKGRTGAVMAALAQGLIGLYPKPVDGP